MGFRARDIDAWSTASGETGIGGREGGREGKGVEGKGGGGSVDGSLSKRLPARKVGAESEPREH